MSWRLPRMNLEAVAAQSDVCFVSLPLDPAVANTSILGLIQQKLASDEELARQLQDGNADALTVLFNRHSKLLFRIARRILRNDAEAEDAVQQIFLDVFRSIRQFNCEKGTFKRWLLMFAYQRTFNSRRSQISSQFYNTDTLGEDLSQGVCPADNNILVEQVLRTLKPRQRRTIELIYREGLTAEEVSVRTGESVRVVRHNLYRGLDTLRRAFCDEKRSPAIPKEGLR